MGRSRSAYAVFRYAGIFLACTGNRYPYAAIPPGHGISALREHEYHGHAPQRQLQLGIGFHLEHIPVKILLDEPWA